MQFAKYRNGGLLIGVRVPHAEKLNAQIKRERTISMTEQLTKILKEDSGVKSEYRHAPKRATPGDAIEISGAILKWYAVHPEAEPVPNEITTLARSFLLKTADRSERARVCHPASLRKRFLFSHRQHLAREQRSVGDGFLQEMANA